MRYVVTALTYAEVMSLKRSLVAQGIEASLKVGALVIHPGTEQVGTMYELCGKYGTTPYQGRSLVEDLNAGRITIDEVIAKLPESKQ